MSRPQLVARSGATSRRVVSDGRISRVVDYFGGPTPDDGPQAYLIEQKNYVLRPHFHPVDQFQILRGGPGSTFGRHPIGDLVVHYADAYTVYGPLVGEDPPLRYFTLRAQPTTATEYMPESRDRLPGPGGRSRHHDVDPAASRDEVIEEDDDGLAVRWASAGPHEPLRIGEPGPAGQFVFVVSGGVEHEGASWPEESVGWHPPGGGAWAPAAGPGGAGVLVLRYPDPGHHAWPRARAGGRRAR